MVRVELGGFQLMSLHRKPATQQQPRSVPPAKTGPDLGCWVIRPEKGSAGGRRVGCLLALLGCRTPLLGGPLANPAGEIGRLGLAGRGRGGGATGGVVAGRESLHRRDGDQGDIDVLQLQTHRQTCRQHGRRNPFLGYRIPVLREQLVEPVVGCGELLVGASDPMGWQTAGSGTGSLIPRSSHPRRRISPGTGPCSRQRPG